MMGVLTTLPFPEAWQNSVPASAGWRQTAASWVGQELVPLNLTLFGIGELDFHTETLFLSTSGVTHGACDLLGSGVDKYNFCT
jgi:hypothetical protein